MIYHHLPALQAHLSRIYFSGVCEEYQPRVCGRQQTFGTANILQLSEIWDCTPEKCCCSPRHRRFYPRALSHHLAHLVWKISERVRILWVHWMRSHGLEDPDMRVKGEEKGFIKLQ